MRKLARSLLQRRGWMRVDKEVFVSAMYQAMSAEDFYGKHITKEYVRERVDYILSGEQPKNGPDVFIQRELVKYQLAD